MEGDTGVFVREASQETLRIVYQLAQGRRAVVGQRGLPSLRDRGRRMRPRGVRQRNIWPPQPRQRARALQEVRGSSGQGALATQQRNWQAGCGSAPGGQSPAPPHQGRCCLPLSPAVERKTRRAGGCCPERRGCRRAARRRWRLGCEPTPASLGGSWAAWRAAALSSQRRRKRRCGRQEIGTPYEARR